MGFTLMLLIIGSIFSGFYLKQSFIGFGSNFFGNSIFILSKSFQAFDFEFIPLIFKLLPLVFSIFGVVLALVFNRFFFSINSKLITALTLKNNILFVQTQKNKSFFFFLNFF